MALWQSTQNGSTHFPQTDHGSPDAGFVFKKTIRQLYDPERNMFLPDRFIKGTCPK
ncbi:MAG TPA: hypothetical protein EYP43_02025, partial [Thermoplasmata archaeon]|nr:hypothetical protein [Thermoplasmata archaeon]